MPLFHLIYVSSATVPFPETDLLALLERSRRNNVGVGITGLLLFRDGNFMQVLEGEEPAVRETHARILQDDRHRGAITLVKEAIAERTFADWSMGFRNLDSEDLRKTPGYSEFLNESWFGHKKNTDPRKAVQLLHFFRARLR